MRQFPSPQDIDTTAEEIASYLRAHRDAADSLDHIATWWLSRQRYERARELVALALSRLVERGEVARSTGPDGTVIYARRNHPKGEGT